MYAIQMSTVHCSRTIQRMAALLPYFTVPMKHGRREQTGVHSCQRESLLEVRTRNLLTKERLFAKLGLAMALSNSYIVVVTTKSYVRVYTLFGTPYKVYRQKSPAVTCAAWRDYVITIGNGPVGADGRAILRYTVENIKRNEVFQNEDAVALAEGTELASVFFSDTGVSAGFQCNTGFSLLTND